MKHVSLAALAGAAALILSAVPAFAVVAFPIGTPANSNTTPFVLDGIYTSDEDLGAQPFASAAFTLEVNIPTNVFISNPNPNTPEAFFISSGISGSYEDGGQTEDFSNGALQVNQFVEDGGPITQLQVDIYDVLTSSDYLYIYPQLSGSLYTFSADSTMATTKSGLYIVPQGEAYYSGPDDPPFTGIATVSAAPEPSTWALMFAGIGGIGFAFRQAKRRHRFKVANSV